jgi:SAM-dependent methyltransferase
MTPQNTPHLIDCKTVARRRDRAAAGFDDVGFLKSAVADRLMDRIDTIKRDLPDVLDAGCHTGGLTSRLLDHPKIKTVKAFDPSPVMARITADRFGIDAVPAPFEDMPFADTRFDAVVSAFALHWSDDLPGSLIQLAHRLKPDGVLLVALAGGETLSALRNCLASAESEVTGGMSPRVLPMGDIRDMGGLIGRAGLTMPVADSDTITVTYPDLFKLMGELRAMGETNAMSDRLNHPTSRRVFLRAAELYQEQYGDGEGRLPADFEIITLTGWAPDASQPKPLKPGSAEARLATALGTDEKDPIKPSK